MRRIDWADAARGVAILAVVWGHATADGGNYKGIVFAWHVPLFFLLSGFLYRPRGSFAVYATHRARQLLVPLVCWTFLTMLPSTLGEAARHDTPALFARARVVLFAGPMFNGVNVGYWFLPALYLTLVAYDGLNRIVPRILGPLCALAYALAGLRSHFLRDWRFEASADAVLFALPFIHLGRLARERGWAEDRRVLFVGLAVFLVFASAVYTGHNIPVYDISQGDNGQPVTTLIFGLSGIATVFLFCQLAGPLNRPLAYVGQASLVVLVLHGSVIRAIDQRPFLPLPTWATRELAFAIAAGVPVLLFPVLRAGTVPRRLLLGEGSASKSKIEPNADESLAPEPIAET